MCIIVHVNDFIQQSIDNSVVQIVDGLCGKLTSRKLVIFLLFLLPIILKDGSILARSFKILVDIKSNVGLFEEFIERFIGLKHNACGLTPTEKVPKSTPNTNYF